MFENKDWRKCQDVVQEFRLCIAKNKDRVESAVSLCVNFYPFT